MEGCRRRCSPARSHLRSTGSGSTPYFARDIQRLFGFRDINRFNALFEYVLRQSGGLFEVSRTAAALGISRPTVDAHLRALEMTHAVTVVRPFHGGGQKEIVKQPRVYGFDTGFVSFVRGWDPLRPSGSQADYRDVFGHPYGPYVDRPIPRI